MDALDHLRIAWRNRWVLLALVAVSGLAVWGIVASRPARFEARAVVAVSLVRPDGSQYDAATVAYLSRSYASLATTRPVLTSALSGSGVSMTPAAAAHRVTVASPNGDGFVTITSSHAPAATVKALAQGVADALVSAASRQQGADAASDLDRINRETNAVGDSLASLPAPAPEQTALTQAYAPLITAANNKAQQVNSPLVVVSSATTTEQRAPAARYAVFALVAAAFLFGEGSVVVSGLRDRFAPDAAAEAVAPGVPVLAFARRRRGSSEAEAARALRTQLRLLLGSSGRHAVAVVDVTGARGATRVAIALADAFADLGLPATIVDGDLRQPRVHEVLEVPLSPGLSEALRGVRVPPSATGRGGEALRALAAGAVVADPAAALSNGLRDVLFAHARQDEVVIVPTPPADAYADAVAITAACDAAVLVVNLRATRRRAVGRVLDALRLVRGNVVGAFVTDGSAYQR